MNLKFARVSLVRFPNPLASGNMLQFREPYYTRLSHLFHFCEVISFPRQQIQVDEIFVHENYTVTGSKANDIALLRLGEKSWIFCRILQKLTLFV